MDESTKNQDSLPAATPYKFHEKRSVDSAFLKQACTSFIATFKAYIGSTLTPTQQIKQDLEELHPDEVEEMDLKWKMAMIAYI
ncbi:hypothetical protein QVD17_24509 [Tagetes erecta]|uniref:Uncharacterized protein n=1 Tax=Tagetes erecta TaxID=13708 RepID=A0AAD8KK91_TARER|nr:hypothetical protein QVD17_24509 [Tagetes erecta]